MRTKATSTIAALCYSRPTELDFEALVAEFNEALGGSVINRIEMPENAGDFVTFNTSEAQICLAYANSSNQSDTDRAPHYCASFVLSVGTGPNTSGAGPIFDQRWQLCGDLIGRIEEMYPSDHSVWVEIDDVFTKDICDRFVTSLWGEDGNALKFSAAMWPYLEPDKILPELDRRLVDEFTRAGTHRNSSDVKKRITPRPNLLPVPTHAMSVQPEILDAQAENATQVEATPQNDGFGDFAAEGFGNEDHGASKVIVPTHPAMYADMPHRRERPRNLPAVIGGRVAIGDPTTAEEDAMLFREALYPPELAEENSPRANPLPHRLAIYTMNITLIVIAAPVGAAMMTYCACGRENMNVMGRAMALTGLALGFGSTEAGAAIMPFLS